MSNIEKIRAEIERRKVDYLNRSYTFVPFAMEQLLEFIDSLPEEEPSKDLEEAAEQRARKIYPYEGGTKGLICETSIPIFKAGFIAGAEWQKQQMMKEAVEFECIGKKVKMTVQELINYYIDTECCDVADECGF